MPWGSTNRRARTKKLDLSHESRLAVLASADPSSSAEMSAVMKPSRRYFDHPETTLTTHQFHIVQPLTMATSNRRLLGTVYAIWRLGQRYEQES